MAGLERTHYDVLEIARDADAAQVRRAWKVMVQAWHPDRFEGEMREEAEGRTARINEAYQVLRDGSRRAAYDCRLAADERDGEATRRPSRSGSGAFATPSPSQHVRARSSHGARHAVRGAAHAAAATRPAPRTTADHLQAVANDFVGAMRRHPRITAVAVAAWVLVFGGSFVLHAFTGPSLPAGAEHRAAPAASVSAVAMDDGRSEATDDLAELMEQARSDADRAEQEMAEMLRQDAAAAAAEAAAAQAAPVPRAPRGAAGGGVGSPRAPRAGAPRPGATALRPRVETLTAPDGSRILRVLPTR